MARGPLLLILLAGVAGLIAYLLLTGEPTSPPQIVPPGSQRVARPPSGAVADQTSPPGATGVPPAAAAQQPTETTAADSAPAAGTTMHASIDARQDAKIARGLRADPEGGLRVEDTPPGSLVEELRLLPGDVIVSVNGESVATPEDFVRIYRTQGRPTQMTVMREGRELHRH